MYELAKYALIIAVLKCVQTQLATMETTPAEINEATDEFGTCDCGIGRSSKIVGGTDTAPHQFPWMVALAYNGFFGCGGSLITDRHVITAAHCVHNAEPSTMRALIGAHNITHVEPTVKVRKIKLVTEHPGYNDILLINDIAILTLDEPVKFNNNVRPVCLPSTDDLYKGKNLTVAGWGYLRENGLHTSEILRNVDVQVLGNPRCRQTYFKIIFSSHICAGAPDGGRDACQGDSGGPLMEKKGSRWHLAGVVSYGEGCARAKFPGLYTRVNKFLDWITKTTEEAKLCENNE